MQLIEHWKVNRIIKNDSIITFLAFNSQAYLNAHALKRLSFICYYRFTITKDGFKLSFSKYPKRNYSKFNGRINTSYIFGNKTTFLLEGPVSNLRFTNVSKKINILVL